MCCLGVSAALSLSTSIGATFLTRDATLRPILLAALGVTLTASALTYWRHRGSIGPLLVTFAASVWIYALIFVVDSNHGGASHDTTNDHFDAHASTAAAVQHGFSTTTQVLVWAGFAVLVGAQLWDLLRIRARPTSAANGGPGVE
jgi:hypothetical protein